MRILHIDPDDMDNPLSGGGPIRTYEIYKRIAKHHEVTILTPTFPGSTPEKMRDGIRYVRLGRKIRNHGSSHHITFLASLPAAVRRFDYDLLVEDLMPPASATWTPLFRRRDKPFIGSVQWFNARLYTQWLKLPFHWGETHGIRLYPNLVVLTESMRTRILATHPTLNSRVIPNGVPSDLFDVPLHAGNHLLYLGRVEIAAKGIDKMLESLGRIPAPLRPRLVLAGTVQQRPELERLLDATGTRDWITVFGPYNAEQRRQLLRDCRALVMPSRLETFGMVITEANAAGVPVLLWDRPPMNEVCAPGSMKIASGDFDGMAAAMYRIMQSSDEDVLALGHMAREHARQYDWDSIAASQLAFYEEVAEAHRSQQPGSRHGT
jgi:phosphatidylinositol alpha-mannosyltransferase